MAVLVVGLVVGGWPAVEGFVGLLIGAAWWHEVVVAAWYVLARWLRLVVAKNVRPSTACACQLKCGTGSATDGNSLQGGNLFAVTAYRGYHPRFSDPKLPLLQRAAWTAKDLKLKLQMCHGRCPHQRWQQYLAGAAWSTADFVEIVRRWA